MPTVLAFVPKYKYALVKHFVGESEHFLNGMFERFSSEFPVELAS